VPQRLPDRSVVGDKARAKVFAERAYAARKVLAADNNPTAIEFKHLAKQPVDYHVYGERMKCYDGGWEASRGYAERNLKTGSGIRVGGRDTVLLDDCEAGRLR
jgi:hypothetical protein